MEIVQSFLFLMTQWRKVWHVSCCFVQISVVAFSNVRPSWGSRWDGLRFCFEFFSKHSSWWWPCRRRHKVRYALCMSVCFETHRHGDKFWNLRPMPNLHLACVCVGIMLQAIAGWEEFFSQIFSSESLCCYSLYYHHLPSPAWKPSEDLIALSGYCSLGWSLW